MLSTLSRFNRLDLTPDGVVTLQYALKRAIETVFDAEPNEIAVVTVGDPAAPNILLYEASEGSLGILSQFVEEVDVFREVIEQATKLCRFDDRDLPGSGVLRRPPQLFQPARPQDYRSALDQGCAREVAGQLCGDPIKRGIRELRGPVSGAATHPRPEFIHRAEVHRFSP